MLIYFLYRLLGLLAFPLIVLYILLRGLRDRRYWAGLGERFGGAPPQWSSTVPGGIWLHAVSVGEVVSSIELLRQLRKAFPVQPLFVSVATVAGREIAETKLKGIADAVFYAPIDWCWSVRRVLRRLKPQVVVVMETEIWPNLYREAKRYGCGLIIVNGRISDRAYPRYLKFRWLFRAVLRWPDAILVQNAIAAERYEAVGAPRERIRDNGNLKYDFQAESMKPPAVVSALIERTAGTRVWIAASTMPPAIDGDPDEDDVVVDAFVDLAKRHPKLLLMLVPRRPERFDLAARKLESAGVRYVRRSQLSDASVLDLPGVLLVDTMGELVSMFQLADVVFMGGTLPHRGGHNILEPAFFSKPVIVGPHMENFPDIDAEFRGQNAVYPIDNAAGLAPAVEQLLNDGEMCVRIGAAARTLAGSRSGATARAVAAIRNSYSEALPRILSPLWARIMLWPLRRLWVLGTAIDRYRKSLTPRTLKTPVISIGGIAMGGTGKTPLVAHLARQLHEENLNVAILTRGYRRSCPEPVTILSPGEASPVARTGDEAQIFVREGHTAIGIGADRFQSGTLIEQRFPIDAFLLDDGFQHWRLRRTADIVVLDGLRPFPQGMSREPIEALRRASAFVVSRAQMPLPWTGLERELQRVRPNAPIFYCRVFPLEWMEVEGPGRFGLGDLQHSSVGVFCGLGNPGSFYSTLKQLNIAPRFRWSFGDHHVYRPRQLERLAAQAREAGATALLTTEKDFMNLPENARKHTAEIPIYWLKTRLEMDREDEFVKWVLEALGRKSGLHQRLEERGERKRPTRK